MIYNLTESDFEKRIEQIENAIESAVLDIEELELTSKDISFAFPLDPSITSDQVPVIVIIELLFETPKRTPEVRNLLARSIALSLQHLFLQEKRFVSKIEVGIPRFNQKTDGFCSVP